MKADDNIPYHQCIVQDLEKLTWTVDTVPPVTIDEALSPLVASLVPEACYKVLQGAVSLSTLNPGRMALLNHLLVNEFDNTTYPAVVKLTLGLTVVLYLAQGRFNPLPSFVEEAAKQALTFSTSCLVVSSEELMKRLTDVSVRAALQNTKAYSHTCQALENINLGTFEHFKQPQLISEPRNTLPGEQVIATAPKVIMKNKTHFELATIICDSVEYAFPDFRRGSIWHGLTESLEWNLEHIDPSLSKHTKHSLHAFVENKAVLERAAIGTALVNVHYGDSKTTVASWLKTSKFEWSFVGTKTVKKIESKT